MILPRETGILPDIEEDIQETKEWLEAFTAVLDKEGSIRAHDLLENLIEEAERLGIHIKSPRNTPYVNTIPSNLDIDYPGDLEIESRIRSYVRWNAMAMVVKANKQNFSNGGDLGGHIASFASLTTMIGCGQDHFWHAENATHGGDLIYIQGHAAPGIYGRAYLEGRITEKQMDHFRQEVDGIGLSSYPHPKLMPEFWQFPTVSMGLGPIMGIYQARFLKYLQARGIANTSGRKVWVFCGDGEMDEPESLGALSIAARENLDNLIFVINCNLQRLDGPVRGNGKIIQELESIFRGAGWNIIKLIWGRRWDTLLNKDKDGILKKIMQETLDGEYQAYKANDGKFVRENFFGKHPKLLEYVSQMSNEEIWRLNRGGHDPYKVYSAFNQAINHKGQPSVILAKTIKGYGLGSKGQAKNPIHQQKKLDLKTIRQFRDRFCIPIPDDQLDSIPYYKPHADSPEMRYLNERRKSLGGYLPNRRRKSDENFKIPDLDYFKDLLIPTIGDRKISTTHAFVQILNKLLRCKELGKRIVPILADESRTFGMEGLFRQIGIYAPEGQKYVPEDKNQLMYYREEVNGQLLQEGINEAGAMSSWIAAATSYSTNNRIMIPFYIYYSMFGFQRVGDLAWAAGDMRARGFLLGGTSGRTTLNGEGLQHGDGHSHILSSTIPNCISYDPTFSYELVVIICDGLKRMIENQEDVYYYLTLTNENYSHPGLKRIEDKEGIIKGIYKYNSRSDKKNKSKTVQLMGSGAILLEVLEAQELLEKDWNIPSDVWSVTSFTELRREGLDIERYNLFEFDVKSRKIPYITQKLSETEGPIIASTDYMKLFADQIRPFIPQGRTYRVLGTDGFGRSDFRVNLRRHFEINRHFIVLTALKALVDEKKIIGNMLSKAIQKYKIDIKKCNPHYA